MLQFFMKLTSSKVVCLHNICFKTTRRAIHSCQKTSNFNQRTTRQIRSTISTKYSYKSHQNNNRYQFINALSKSSISTSLSHRVKCQTAVNSSSRKHIRGTGLTVSFPASVLLGRRTDNSYKRWFSNTPNATPTNNTNNDKNVNNSNEEKDSMENLHSAHRMREREKIGDIIEGIIPPLQTVKHPHVAETIETTHDIYEFNDATEDYMQPHPIWTESQTNNIEITHVKPRRLPDYLAYISVQTLRFTWDLCTGYTLGRQLGLFKFTHNMWLLRLVYLETVAGVPGMMFGMVRHLNSLRQMRRDHGWIHTLLAEAENERMHLLTFLKLYQPSKGFRYLVVAAQFLMSNFLFPCYLISPRFCHKFVGYLEEEAVKTYTGLLKDIDAGLYPQFNGKCNKIARDYWQLNRNATWRDVILQIRADESHHRDVNHTLAPLASSSKAANPFRNDKR